jgi:hypothetical protein
MEQLEKKLKEKEDFMYKNEKSNLDKDISKKTFTLSKRINNIPFLNTYASNKYTNHKNLNSIEDSPVGKRYIYRGRESTHFNFNKLKKINEPNNIINKLSPKYKINTLGNNNAITSTSKTPNFKSYKSGSKILGRKNDNSLCFVVGIYQKVN